MGAQILNPGGGGAHIVVPVVIAPVLGLVSAAGANTGLINAALANGGLIFLIGEGVAYINAPLIYQSNTNLVIDPALQIQLAPGLSVNMLQSQAYATFLTQGGTTGSNGIGGTAVTTSWTAGRDCPVNFPNHGCQPGDYLWMLAAPAADAQYSGVFAVESVTDTNNLTVKLWRVPTAVPTSQVYAVKATRNVEISGGIWFYDDVNNGSSYGSSFAQNGHTMIHAGVAHLDHHDFQSNSNTSYSIMLCGYAHAKVRNFWMGASKSDMMKVYGPGYDLEVENFAGLPGDDLFSIQPKDAPAYLNKQPAWGDIIKVRARNLTAITQGNFHIATAYASAGYITEDVVFDGVHGTTLGHGAGVEAPDSGTVGRIAFLNITCRAVYPCYLNGASYISECTVGLNDAQVDTTGLNGSQIHLYTDPSCTIAYLKVQAPKITDTSYGASGSPQYIHIGGPTYRIDVTDPFIAAGLNVQFLYLVPSTARVDQVLIRGGYIYANYTVETSGTFTNVPEITFDSLECNAAVGVRAQVATNLNVKSCLFTRASSGIVNAALGTGIVNLRTDGCNKLSTTSGTTSKWFLVASGTPVINLQGEDIQVDVSATGVARNTGNKCYNTNAALGGLGSAGVVDCLGTAANSWRLRGAPTLQY